MGERSPEHGPRSKEVQQDRIESSPPDLSPMRDFDFFLITMQVIKTVKEFYPSTLMEPFFPHQTLLPATSHGIILIYDSDMVEMYLVSPWGTMRILYHTEQSFHDEKTFEKVISALDAEILPDYPATGPNNMQAFAVSMDHLIPPPQRIDTPEMATHYWNQHMDRYKKHKT